MSDNKVVLMFNVKQPDDLYKIAIAGVDLPDADYNILLDAPETEAYNNIIAGIKNRIANVPGADVDDCSIHLPNPSESYDELVERIKDIAIAMNPKVLKH